MADDPFAACEESVRRHDPDRYFSGLFAPEDKRRHLFVLYALYYELAHAVAVAREPMLAAIRLAWWRETVEGARAGTPREHPVAKALVETLAVHDLPQDLFATMIEGWSPRAPFTTAVEAEEHADATVGSLMRLSTLVLGAEVEVRDAAIAYGLAGRRGGLWSAIDTDALARRHFAAARKTAVAKAALPAVMPAALVPLYRKHAEPPLWRKQIVYVRVAITGKL